MSFTIKSRKLIWLVSLIGLTMMLSAVPARAQFYDLEIKVADTVGFSGDQNSVISIWMRNWSDTVAGYEIWLMLEKPDIMEFQHDSTIEIRTLYYLCTEGTYPSSCTDSLDVTDSVLIYGGPTIYTNWEWSIDIVDSVVSGNHDVSGTLSENWEYVSSRSIGGNGHDLKIVAQANTLAPPYTQGIGYPQVGEIPMVKILADIYEISDTLTGEDRQCRIFIQADNLDNFSFSDEDGNAIGVVTDTLLDTSWFNCQGWYNDSCISWLEVGVGPADSMFCCDTLLSGHLDTSLVKITHGTLTVLVGMCGDVNCNTMINLLDVTYLIAYLYQGGPAPCSEWAANVNGDAGINILDITYLIGYLYMGGPAPACQ